MTSYEHDYAPKVSRRAVLRGLGATLTLPWLESLARAAGGGTAAAADSPPRRWGLMLFANGVSEAHWWARGEGAALELSETLRPLEPYKQELLFLNGLRLFDRTFGPHWPFFTNFLSGQELREETVPNVAESLDQRLARVVGRHTALPSLHLGVEPPVPGLRLGVPGIYYSTVSWSSRQTAIPPEIYPRQAFDRLFDSSRLLQDRSVLDAVLEQSHGLRPRLSAADRQRLDRYTTNIRELERRIRMAGGEGQREGWRPTADRPDLPRPGAELPALPEHIRLMCDILVLALQMDRTRVATLLFENDATRCTFEFLEGVSNTPMHSLSHYRGDDMLAQYRRINQYHVEQLAYVLGRMRDIDEGGSTLLDNTMLLFGSNMMDGNRHDATHLPLILCGRGGGSLRPGRVLTYESDSDRRLCNLFVAMMNRMGLPDRRFGNSVHALPGLS